MNKDRLAGIGVFACLFVLASILCYIYNNKRNPDNLYYDSRGMAYTSYDEYVKDSIKQDKLDSIRCAEEEAIRVSKSIECVNRMLEEARRDSIIEARNKAKAYLEVMNNRKPSSYNITITPNMVTNIDGNPINYNCVVTPNY